MIGYIVSIIFMIQGITKGDPILFVVSGLFAVAGAISKSN